jgi:hypothetical protein
VSTFLELAQKVASESGTVPARTTTALPTTVVSQVGRLGRIVRWTNDAWRSIQNSRAQWRWMRGELSGTISSGTQRYLYSALGAGSPTRFAEWIVRGEDETRWSCYKTSTGVSDEGPLNFLDWDTFYETQLRGTPPTNSRPQFFSIDDTDRLVFSPTPDATYTVRGWYRKDVQELSANSDTPEMPARFHDLILWEALKLLGNFDEAAVGQRAEWANNARIIRSQLERDQLPPIRICGPLA